MNGRKRYRLAHAFAVRELQQLGRELTDGTWAQTVPGSGELQPLSVADALVVIASAMDVVARVGVASVVEAASDAVEALMRSMLRGA